MILLVVDKGKMGITYPKSLINYDLRLRYTSGKMVKRTPFEQDLGRACRYKTDISKEYPLPTVFISKWCHDQVISKINRSGIDRGGLMALETDYSI